MIPSKSRGTAGRRRRVVTVICQAMTLAVAACTAHSGTDADVEPGVVARIGTQVIRAEDLRDFVAQIPPPLRSRQVGDGARREYLRSLMARHLLAMEAAGRGLDSAAVVARRVDGRWRQHLAQLYRMEKLAPLVEVSEDEISQYFDAHQMARERQLAAIVVNSEAAAREVVERLKAGESFEALAAEVSVDERSAPSGGVLGFLSVDGARKLKIPGEVFHTLEAGVVGPIIPLGRSFQVIRFLQERQAGVEEQREAVERVIYEFKRVQQESEHVSQLGDEFGWRPDAAGIEAVVRAARPRGYARRRDLADDEAQRPLFHHVGGVVRVGDYLDAVWTNPPMAVRGWGTADSAAVMEAGQALVLAQEMLVEAAKRDGMAERPEEKAWLRRVTEEFAIEELRRQEAVAPSRVSGDEARAFYHQHPEAFVKPMEAYAVEVLAKSEEEALRVLAETGRGRALAGLAEDFSVRDGAREQAGVIVVDSHMRLGHPRLYRAVVEAPIDEVTGPVPVEGGYSVFQVIHREGGEVLPFAEVESKARALARKERKDDLLGELIDEVFERLGDEVVVYDRQLAMALPDSLLEADQASRSTSTGSP